MHCPLSHSYLPGHANDEQAHGFGSAMLGQEHAVGHGPPQSTPSIPTKKRPVASSKDCGNFFT